MPAVGGVDVVGVRGQVVEAVGEGAQTQEVDEEGGGAGWGGEAL